mgnify:CR=1 FL=1
MNRPIPFSATLIALAIASPPLLAADNTQLQQLQQEIAAMRKDYETQRKALEVRLKQAEAIITDRVSGFLLFHKVLPPNTHPSVTTGFGAFGSTSTGAFFQDFNNANYNVNGVDPSAIRVYGCTGFYITFDFAIGQPVSMFLAMDTIDGVRANL